MSLETQIRIDISFQSETKAQEICNKLDELAIANNNDICKAINGLYPISEPFLETHIEEIERTKSTIHIYAYYWKNEAPIWFVNALFNIDAEKVHVYTCADNHESNYYYKDTKKVSKATFFGEQKKKKLSSNRVVLCLELIDYEWVDYDHSENGYSYYLFRMITDDGSDVFYKGNSKKMVPLITGEYGRACQLTGALEKEILFDKEQWFIKKPTKVTLRKADPLLLSVSDFCGTNKYFIETPKVDIILPYLHEFQGNVSMLLESVMYNSILGLKYIDIMQGYNSLSDAILFNGFGLDIYADNNELTIKTNKCDQSSNKLKCLIKNITDNEIEYEERYNAVIWKIDKYEITAVVFPAFFSLVVVPDTSNMEAPNFTLVN